MKKLKSSIKIYDENKILFLTLKRIKNKFYCCLEKEEYREVKSICSYYSRIHKKIITISSSSYPEDNILHDGIFNICGRLKRRDSYLIDIKNFRDIFDKSELFGYLYEK